MPFSKHGWYRRPLGWFFERFVLDYLLSPWRIAGWCAFVIGAGWFIYGIFASDTTLTHGNLAPNESVMERWNSSLFAPLYFSLTTFVTLGYGDFAPLGWFKLVTGVEALLGVALLALFTVAWARKMVR